MNIKMNIETNIPARGCPHLSQMGRQTQGLDGVEWGQMGGCVGPDGGTEGARWGGGGQMGDRGARWGQSVNTLQVRSGMKQH